MSAGAVDSHPVVTAMARTSAIGQTMRLTRPLYTQRMCCFSGRVENVDSTKIFARPVGAGRQILVYQMKLAASAEVAMILPIPVPPRSSETAVRFISLEAYPDLFDDIDSAFPRQMCPPQAKLAVHAVGAFVASFVPSLAEFSRLDRRFQIPPGTLDRMPIYSDWGFAVFQLRATRSLETIHPMAFELPTRSDQLFFPTVHVHDGTLPDTATFSHELYAQHVVTGPGKSWWPSGRPLGTRVDPARAANVIDPAASVAKLSLFGRLPNVDTWAAIAPAFAP